MLAYDPEGCVDLLATIVASVVRRVLNLIWRFFRTFLQELDVRTLDVLDDFYSYLDDYSVAGPWAYLFRTIILWFFNPFSWLSSAFSAGFGTEFGLPQIQLRPLQGWHNPFRPCLRIMAAVIRRFVVDTGATHHLSYRLLDGDVSGPWQPVGTAAGGKEWIRFSAKEHCIMPEPKPGAVRADELLAVGCVVECGASFHWVPQADEPSKAWFDHPALADPIPVSYTHLTLPTICSV